MTAFRIPVLSVSILLALGTVARSADARRTTLDHVGAYNFKLEIEGRKLGEFAGSSAAASPLAVDLAIVNGKLRKHGRAYLRATSWDHSRLAKWWNNRKSAGKVTVVAGIFGGGGKKLGKLTLTGVRLVGWDLIREGRGQGPRYEMLVLAFDRVSFTK